MAGYAGLTAAKQLGIARAAQRKAIGPAMPRGHAIPSKRSGTRIVTSIGKASQPGMRYGSKTSKSVVQQINPKIGPKSHGTIDKAMNKSQRSGGVGTPPHIARAVASKAFTSRRGPKSRVGMGPVAGSKTAAM